MNADFMIKLLNASSPYDNAKLSEHQKNWLYDNVEQLHIWVEINDLIRTNLTCDIEPAMRYIQDTDDLKRKYEIDLKRSALMLLPRIGFTGYILFWYIPSKKKTRKNIKIIYGISTIDDEIGNRSVKAYCNTYDIAIRESRKHYNWWCSTPVGEDGIVPIKLIIE